MSGGIFQTIIQKLLSMPCRCGRLAFFIHKRPPGPGPGPMSAENNVVKQVSNKTDHAVFTRDPMDEDCACRNAPAVASVETAGSLIVRRRVSKTGRCA